MLSLSGPQFLPLCNLEDALDGPQGPSGIEMHGFESTELWPGLGAQAGAMENHANEWEGALGEAVGSLSNAWLLLGWP